MYVLHVITVTDKDADVQSTVYYVFFVIWILSALISSCYTFAWDIKMDWGFFEKGRIIREETIYYYKVSLSLSLSNIHLLCCYGYYCHGYLL